MGQSVLTCKEGKYVTIKSFEEELMLCAVDVQSPAPLVVIFKRLNNQLAFRFQYKNQWYFPKVDRDNLKLEKAACNCACQLSEGHWFKKEKCGAGEHYLLQSVSEPKKYISMSQSRGSVLRLCTEMNESVQVTDKAATNNST